jgi:hypothetical protein
LVVSQPIEYGAEVTSVPKFAPSSRNWTPVSVEPELDAVAETVVVLETVEPLTGAVKLTVGGVPPPEVKAGNTSTMLRL